MSDFGPIILYMVPGTWLSKLESSSDKSLHNNISTIHLLRDFIWKFTQLFTFIYPRYRIIFHVWYIYTFILYSDLCRPYVRVDHINKFALLWGEAQVCLPHVCLKKNINNL